MKLELTKTCYKFFSMMANPTRIAVLENLRRSPMSVKQLAEALQQEQSMVSHNLSPLVRCRFINVERKGKKRIYSLNSETIEALFSIVENHSRKYCPTMGHCIGRRGR
ncbi:winged helix-turn-helix transcriptional regulator [Candidatus Bathyarchaeota archaeon]|nr:winged helix-turn-helix transcriptional regulator [Candidatus Bathyarchaeota archaeon]MBS7631620.1 winged helix-turn-helix transcriptional regulator [Candidatus Bathyarchaeota archaeon]